MAPTIRNPRTLKQAVSVAHRYWVTRRWCRIGACDGEVARVFGWTYSGEYDAVTHWRNIPNSLKVKAGDTDPKFARKVGYLEFWSGGSAGHGHVAIVGSSVKGVEMIVTIDLPESGFWGKVKRTDPRTKWGLTYLGYAKPYFPHAG